MMQYKRAFTLIELLVVLAVIAAIAAILFPVFAAAREKARQVTCASNLRQLGMAFSQYGDDNDGRLPLPGSDDAYDASQDGPYWDLADPQKGGGINAYVKARSSGLTKSPSIWMCPDMPDYYETTIVVPGTSVTFQQLTARTYVMNWFLRDPSPDSTGALVYPEDAHPDADPAKASGLYHLVGGFNNPLSLPHVITPSETILLFEGVPNQGVSPVGPYLGLSRRSGDFSFQKGYMPSRATSQDVNSAEGIGTGGWQPSTPWHSGFNNYLFCDDHVHSMPVKPYPWTPTRTDNDWFVQRYR